MKPSGASTKKEMYESHSCSVSNEADAFKAAGPTKGNSLFVYNYYGPNLIHDEGGLFNKVNLDDRVPEDEHQVWRYTSAELEHKSGNTDSWFSCTMTRSFTDKDAHIRLKVGQELTWIWGYKVFELKTSEGLDRYSIEHRTMKILDSAIMLSNIYTAGALLLTSISLLTF